MGDPVDCGACGMSGRERARDSSGRFVRMAVTDSEAVHEY
jgi:hypothetical protein